MGSNPTLTATLNPVFQDTDLMSRGEHFIVSDQGRVRVSDPGLAKLMQAFTGYSP